MTELQLFDVAGQQWRFGQDEAGRPWVVAADVARAFDYRDAANALRLLADDEKGTQIVSTPGGDQRMSVIYEDGVLELVFLSRKPEARAIKNRVKDILREIRETGGYAVATMSPAEFLVHQAQLLLAQERRVRQLGAEVAQVSARVDGIEQRAGWLTSLAFSKLNGLPTDRRSLQVLGIAATKAARDRGVEPVKIRNDVYGVVNTYPEWALIDAAGGAA